MEGARGPGGTLLNGTKEPGEVLESEVNEEGEVGGGPLVQPRGALAGVGACAFEMGPEAF